jgi:hypothetical protein
MAKPICQQYADCDRYPCPECIRTEPLGNDTGWHKFADEQPPRGEMFIWAVRREGHWSLGLAYWTVSGRWSDAYGRTPDAATHWKRIGNPPE